MKPTKKQIEAEIRRKMDASYNSHIESLKKRINVCANNSYRLAGEFDILWLEIAKLKKQIRQYEDWNERLMEFIYEKTLTASKPLPSGAQPANTTSI